MQEEEKNQWKETKNRKHEKKYPVLRFRCICLLFAFSNFLNLAAFQSVRSLQIAVKGSHGAALLKKLVNISNLGFENRSLAP